MSVIKPEAAAVSAERSRLQPASSLHANQQAGLLRGVDATEVGDVPVFDAIHRQLGWLSGSGNARSRFADDLGSFTHFCMNAAVRWIGSEDAGADVAWASESSMTRRIPMTDAQGRLCGVVLLRASVCAVAALVETGPAVVPPPTPRWRARARRLAGGL